MIQPPIQSPIMRNGAMTQEWVLFFTKLALVAQNWQPPSFLDANAPDNTVYYSTTGSKLSYKDSGGTVHALY